MNRNFNFRVLWLLLITVSSGIASTFQPECTLPPPGTTYVSRPNIRGTTDILLNCLSIIFLCTWNIQHLNVPAARPDSKSIIQSAWWAILDSRTKAKWMIITMLMPEYLVGKAFGELLAARAGVKEMKSLDLPRGTKDAKTLVERLEHLQWEEIHVYMANMGHFVVDFSAHQGMKLKSTYCLKTEFHRLTRLPGTRVFQNLAKRYCRHHHAASAWNINVYRHRHRTWALNNIQLRLLFEQGVIDLPNISAQKLTELDRGEKLVKFLSVLQIMYLVMQVIDRRLENVPSTQLEIATLAFSASSIITYILYWPRPQDVVSVQVIRAKKMLEHEDFPYLVLSGPEYIWTRKPGSVLDINLDLVPIPNDGHNLASMERLPNWVVRAVGASSNTIPLTVGAVFGGVLFGSLHCLAWNSQFPTEVEAQVWKICSVLTASLPTCAILPAIVWQETHPLNALTTTHSRRMLRFSSGLVLSIILIAYTLARLFLMVESLRSLLYLPPEAFIET